MEGPQVKTILAAESQADIQLVIPEVVVDELRHDVEERLERAVKDAAKVRRDYARLSALSPFAVDLHISSDQVQKVLDRFDLRFGQFASEGRILKYPTASPEELARRSIRAQAPFQGKDRGMRDTLIWLTIKECAAKGATTNPKIALVTEDGVFLNEDKTKLNESLTRELKEAGILPDSIAVWPTLQELIDTLISSQLHDAKWVEVAIESGQIADFTSSDDTVLLKATDWIIENLHILEVGGYEYVEFDIVEEVSLEQVAQTLVLGSDEVLVESEWKCDIAAEGFDNRYFGESVRVTLGFKLSSIVDVSDDHGSVMSHEVTDMNVLEFFRYGPSLTD